MTKPKLWPSLIVCTLAPPALAADVKKECVDASTEGQTSRDAGELRSAREKFVICSRDACPAVVRSSCVGWLGEVDQQLPSIVVRAADASNADVTDGTATVDGVKYSLDGKPILLDPGKHVVEVDTDQGVHIEKKLLLAAGEKSRLIELRVPLSAAEQKADPAPPKAARSSGVPTGAWVLGGLGVVALGSFGYFALSANSELGKLEDVCSPGCSDEQTKTGRTNALVADISLGVGAVALAGALTWALLSGDSGDAPKSAAQLTFAPTPTGANAYVSGRF